MLTGILAVDKPRGMTSHDLVARVRRLARQKQVGHAGTLDPMATGVLLVCLGAATRVSEYLMAGGKWYAARIVLGARTDSDDADGALIGRSAVDLSDEAIIAALGPELGTRPQVPPQYSAIKRDGVPAYRVARAGGTSALEGREITIDSLSVLRMARREVAVREADGSAVVLDALCVDALISCSKGTYIRSVARDVGERLGVGAYLGGLRRLASGGFETSACATLPQLEADVAGEGPGALGRQLMPLDHALRAVPAAVLGAALAERVRHGGAVDVGRHMGRDLLQLHADDASLVALARQRAGAAGEAAALWQPERVFAVGVPRC